MCLHDTSLPAPALCGSSNASCCLKKVLLPHRHHQVAGQGLRRAYGQHCLLQIQLLCHFVVLGDQVILEHCVILEEQEILGGLELWWNQQVGEDQGVLEDQVVVYHPFVLHGVVADSSSVAQAPRFLDRPQGRLSSGSRNLLRVPRTNRREVRSPMHDDRNRLELGSTKAYSVRTASLVESMKVEAQAGQDERSSCTN